MISAVIISKNEEHNIANCIKSLKFCDEIIVVDDYSSDETVKIAKKLGARVYRHYLNNNFSRQRNFALGKAKFEWILFLDSDEIISNELAEEISLGVNNNIINGYNLRRIDNMYGRLIKHGEPARVKLLRLARKGSGVWVRRVHEYWDVQGKTITLKNPIIHFPHQTLREYLNEVSVYSKVHSEENIKENKKNSIFHVVVYPFFKFIDGYLVKQGFLDGSLGFIIAVFMSFHSYLSWSNIWLTNRKYIDT